MILTVFVVSLLINIKRREEGAPVAGPDTEPEYFFNCRCALLAVSQAEAARSLELVFPSPSVKKKRAHSGGAHDMAADGGQHRLGRRAGRRVAILRGGANSGSPLVYEGAVTRK